MKSLLIVESPTKVKTLSKFLGKEFTIKASVGHIKDLPKKELGVDIENNLALNYVVIEGKEKILKDLKKAAKSADKIYLAPDPDREGEAIAWHIAEELNGDSENIFRVEFNAITEKAVKDAIKNPRKIDMDLVDAQQARRVLDRLVGYKLSPLLWEKICRGLSAGRVQSVAVRLVVDREKEVEAFKSEEYWSISAEMEGKEPPLFTAKLFSVDKKKISINNEKQATAIVEDLQGKSFVVSRVEKTMRKRSPAPPFITSTLQQEASRKLRFTAKMAMRIAQQLYEGIELGDEGSVGLITYMRTDSVRVTSEAQQEARAFVRGEFGKDYLPSKPPVYKSKKSAQDAHEAIRPTSLLIPPQAVKDKMTRDQFKLYSLVWNRFVASQMRHAELEQTSVDIAADKYIFRATGTIVSFPGFMKLYIESGDNGSDEEGLLPQLAESDVMKIKGIQPKQHFTQPPARFSEATLVKELEARGIGRPSTYASILSTIQDRKYTEKLEGRFRPTELGVVVSDMLVERFSELMDYNFTANMENNLDKIEEGGFKWVDIVMDFYKSFNEQLSDAMINLEKVKTPTDKKCPEGHPMVIKWGRFGKFFACEKYPEHKYTEPIENEGSGADGQVAAAQDQQTDETCPKCSSPMVLKTGRFGRFLACSKYPDCKTTKALKAPSIGIKCPEDGGDVIEKKTKKGKLFYSCGNYPNCKFATWYKPVEKSCPQCGAGIMVDKRTKKGDFLACINTECKYQEEVQEAGNPQESTQV